MVPLINFAQGFIRYLTLGSLYRMGLVHRFAAVFFRLTSRPHVCCG